MTLNREVFARDPLDTDIPNDGVARVLAPRTSQEWAVLRFELGAFVCEGEYRDGLGRILSTFLGHLDREVQPAVWVSGFYGSGKSHFVRTLENLWKDVELPDGARARGLANLTDEIQAHLRELSMAGRREGGLWSAAGTLTAAAGGGAPGTDSVRLALLAIVLRSAGLPERYELARFVIWLKQNRYHDAVLAHVAAAGRSFEEELRNLYVSPVIASALLQAYPGFAEDAAAARKQLVAQYGPVDDVSDDEMLAVMEDVLRMHSSAPDKLPLTVLILDELQQYLGEDGDRIARVGTAVEACTSRFGSRLLVVATGQQALLGTTEIARLHGRFTVRVTLSDRDVATVVRKVALLKEESRKPEIRRVLEACSGEIDRQLQATKIAPSPPQDEPILVPDYPLLPVRARFWAHVLRAVDKAGTAGQLRSQLTITHAAVRGVANDPLGTVVGADAIFQHVRPAMLQSGALLPEIDAAISRQDDGSEDGRLRSRLAAAAFLIGQLPREGGDIGVRATAGMLADLLVQDLEAGSSELRHRLTALLDGMEQTGALMRIGEEYRLQTRESADWEQDYRSRYARIHADPILLADDRAQALRSAVAGALNDVFIQQGTSKITRKPALVFGAEAPVPGGAVPVWVRDAWSGCREDDVQAQARQAGPDDPTIYVFLPERGAEELKNALTGCRAADDTVATRAAAATREGDDARRSMETRRDEMRRKRDRLIADALREARVYQGGGTRAAGDDLKSMALSAVQASLARLYPEFPAGDDPKWDLVKQRARDGNSQDPLQPLGYTGDTERHPVCQKVRALLGGGSQRGLDVRRHFEAPPYGWPRDTVDGALLALLAAGLIRATQAGVAVTAKQFTNERLAQTEFQSEAVTVGALQRIAVRRLVQEAAIGCKPGEEAVAAATLVAQMAALAESAGGDAPLPAPPGTAHLEALRTLSGNELVLQVYEQRDRLQAERATWQARKACAANRAPHWEALLRLLKHAASLPIHAEIAQQVAAVRQNRSLLDDPDPVPPLAQRLADSLRAAVMAARAQHLHAYDAQMDLLEADSNWQRLSEADQQAIRRANGLAPLPELRVSTEQELLATLDDTPLAQWENQTAAIGERVKRALLGVAQRTLPEPVRVTIPTATLTTAAEVDAYLGQLRCILLEQVAAGKAVVV